ncbi:unnamed protein product [Cunninghamella blakesleeana]
MISTIPLTLFSYDFLYKIIVSILLIASVSFLHAIKYTLINEKQPQPTTTITTTVKQPTQTINTITITSNTSNENSLSPTLINKNHDNKVTIPISKNEMEKQLIIDTINIPGNINANDNDNNSVFNNDNDTNFKKTPSTTKVIMNDLKKNHLNTLSLSPLPLDTLYEESSNNKDIINNNNNDKDKDQPMMTLLSTKCHDQHHYQKNNVLKVEKQKPFSLQPSYSTPTSTLYNRRRQKSNSQFLSHIEITGNKKGNDDDHDHLLTTPLLSPSLSTSTTASNDSWSLSKVESLVNQFENKSLTSSPSLYESKLKIQQSSALKRRSFAFKPIVENWENRIPKDKPYIAPTPSMSTPVWTSRRG